MSDNKPTVQFAPGCFDGFEGTQEELDQLQKEIIEMFANMTPEELAERSRSVDIDELINEDPELAEKLLQSLDNEPRKLQ